MPDTPTRIQRSERFDLNALYETSRLLSSSLDLHFVLNNLLFTAMSKLFVTRGAVLLYEPLERRHRVATARGVKGLKTDDLLDVGTPASGKPLLDDQIPEVLRQHDMHLLLPVSSGHREIGMIALGGKATGQQFDLRELQFIQSLVNMSSAAVHNSLIVSELTQANRDLDNKIQQLNTLFELSQEFNATIDRKRVMKALSFALMGQLLVHRYLLLMRSNAAAGRPTLTTDMEFSAVSFRGMPRPDIAEELAERLCDLHELVLLDESSEREDGLSPLRELGIAIVIPILQHGETCGVLCLGPKMTGQPYEPGDVEFLYALGNLAFVSIQNSFLVEEQIEKERLEEEMRLARQIQERLLPRELPSVPGVQVASLAIPSRHVGGDYFDVIRLDENRLLTAVADVTGKGMPASLLMANLQACLHVLEPMDMTIEEAAAQINRVICENTDSDKFITFFYGIYNAADQTFEYVNAGHNPPLLLRNDDGVERLEIGGLLLGVMKDAAYQRGHVALSNGDLVAMYSDGVTEAADASGEEFGEDRLIDLLRENRDRSPQQIVDVVNQSIRSFTGNPALLQDDLTIVVMKVV